MYGRKAPVEARPSILEAKAYRLLGKGHWFLWTEDTPRTSKERMTKSNQKDGGIEMYSVSQVSPQKAQRLLTKTQALVMSAEIARQANKGWTMKQEWRREENDVGCSRKEWWVISNVQKSGGDH